MTNLPTIEVWANFENIDYVPMCTRTPSSTVEQIEKVKFNSEISDREAWPAGYKSNNFSLNDDLLMIYC